ncbi:hypothetical protein RIU80_20275, partial [Salmonella enterica subsp. enterica serovar Gatineau]|nr:hypothetical protein [Salmonella enterica subsp. enterica serovar Gatineau]MDR7971845.1 hypothetical protein [Salmonella enterica subsp. enterica serovar Gatineau]
EQYDAGGISATQSFGRDLKKCLELKRVYLQEGQDDSVRKVIYLAIKDASKKWSMPIQNWRLAMSRFIVEFGDRLNDHL